MTSRKRTTREVLSEAAALPGEAVEQHAGRGDRHRTRFLKPAGSEQLTPAEIQDRLDREKKQGRHRPR